MKKKNQSSITNRYWLLSLSLICIVLMLLSVFMEQARGPFRLLANVTVIPMQSGINHVGTWLGDISANFETLQELQEDNRHLQSLVDELRMENRRLIENAHELDRLRELYQLGQNYIDYNPIGARVIFKNPGNWFSTFTIDRGSIHGIREDMNVIAGRGLVGIVTEVGPTWAMVRSIIDDQSNVSSVVTPAGEHLIVRGDLSLMNYGKIRFELMANNESEVSVGNDVFTSHVSDLFLQGILVGYITEINVDANNLTRSGYIAPFVDFTSLHEVLVLTTTKADFIQEQGE